MRFRNQLVLLLACLSLIGCATGKSITSAADIEDDGKRNVVLLTHDIKVYVTDKHPSVKQTKLAFRCPKGNDLLKADCFSVLVPYLGTKEFDGFGLHAFEITGAKLMKMEYGDYNVRSLVHNVVVDRQPETTCYYNKKSKQDVCTTTTSDRSDTYRANLPRVISLNVKPGAGCYAGHLSLTVVNNEIREFSLDVDTPLSDEKLTELPDDIATAAIRSIKRPCQL